MTRETDELEMLYRQRRRLAELSAEFGDLGAPRGTRVSQVLQEHKRLVDQRFRSALMHRNRSPDDGEGEVRQASSK